MLARSTLVTALAAGALLAGGTSALAVAPTAAVPSPGTDRAGGRIDDQVAEVAPGLVRRTLPGPAAARALDAPGMQRAAEVNDVTVERLSEIFEDRAAHLAPNGRLFYVDPVAAHAGPEGTEGTEGTAESDGTDSGTTTSGPTAAYSLDQTFALHSRPGSQHTIFLDFDGATVANTWWNSRDLPNATHPAFSLDSDRSSFSSTERKLVQEVWARVAEDFAPFDVDVTTEEPPADALRRTSTSDPTYGTHVLFAPGKSVADALCSGSCSGIAWVGVFNQATGSGTTGPAWVFPDQTNRAAWRLAEVASHEAGHTLGLHHDGTTSASYYTGRSPWGPIMGSSRYGLSQWSNGDYAGANNAQKDLDVIHKYGATALGDDHGGSLAGATPVSSGSVVPGLIGVASDRDVFRLDHGPCSVSATVTTASPGPNLDAQLRVLDATGRVVASDNPTVTETSTGFVTGTGASVTLPERPAGTLYLEVDGVGQGAMPTSGYSDYGSVGRYTLAVSGCGSSGTVDGTGDPGTVGGTGSGTDSGTDSGTTAQPRTDDSTQDSTVTTPGQVRIGKARPGARRGKVTATATWFAPATDGGAAITGYRVTALKVRKNGRVMRRTSWLRPADTSSFSPRLRRGLYRFQVVAINTEGAGPLSARSNRVRAR